VPAVVGAGVAVRANEEGPSLLALFDLRALLHERPKEIERSGTPSIRRLSD
jgi:hypothetical protein